MRWTTRTCVSCGIGPSTTWLSNVVVRSSTTTPNFACPKSERWRRWREQRSATKRMTSLSATTGNKPPVRLVMFTTLLITFVIMVLICSGFICARSINIIKSKWNVYCYYLKIASCMISRLRAHHSSTCLIYWSLLFPWNVPMPSAHNNHVLDEIKYCIYIGILPSGKTQNAHPYSTCILQV